MLLSATSIVFIICSCNKKQDTSSTPLVHNAAEQTRADSILSSIGGQTKIVKINPSKENNIISKKGIQFSIPANAFVTKDGLKPKGNVQVTISEYHNPADILVSKIPMLYQTKNGAAQMESAGMFSITATAKDEELQLAPNKDIAVQVPSKKSDINFNLYYFDPIANAWVQTVDSLSIDQTEPKAHHAPSGKTSIQIVDAGINVEWSAVEANKRMIDGKVISLVKPDCSYKNTDFNFTVATDNFPELNLYKDLVWIGSANKDDRQVEAAFDNDQFINASIIERETPLNRYLMAFQFRHTKFNAYMKIASKSEACELNEELYLSYYDSRPVDENKIEKIATKAKKSKSQSTIFRSFAINKLGLWNCDRLYVLTAKMNITPRFRSITTGESYESTTTYMIDKKINSVWTFTNNIITLDPDSDNIILFINGKGKICYARLNKLSKTHKEKEINLIIDVEEMEENPDNTEALDKLLQSI
ncbi:hypothetical protein [Cytophaga aurantiaca]|uniref:hypothetical protein n=1 Tax=Cytophaga aurantiaca TaxID=29530 RepID=UPI0003A40C5E|nr:hypothetical protein [Cytophaga aurantiaca]